MPGSTLHFCGVSRPLLVTAPPLRATADVPVRRAPARASPQLRQLLRAVFEHTEDRLAVGNVQLDDPGFAVVGAFESFGGGDEPDI
jgi:hypothetical protein